MLDTTDMMKPYIDAWEKVDIFLDAIYSGFLGAPEQVDSIQRLYALFPNALRVVDPVRSILLTPKNSAMPWQPWPMAQTSSRRI